MVRYQHAPDCVFFTDGAALRNGQKDAKGGWSVVYKKNGQIIQDRGFYTNGAQTNNRYELEAVLKTFEIARKLGVTNFAIRPDSKYAINAVTKWIYHWMRNGWITRAGTPVKNRELIETIYAKMMEMRDREEMVQFKYVKAHGKNPLNNEADRNAKIAAFENPICNYQQYRKYRNIPKKLL